MHDFHGKSSSQKDEAPFQHKIGITFKEESSKLLHLEHSSVWRWNFVISVIVSEIPENV
jgi:hypothetical protein